MRLILNRDLGGCRDTNPASFSHYLSLDRHCEAREEISGWPGYRPTPLVSLSALAAELGLAEIWYKDESGRFGVGGFNFLGGAYAAGCALLRRLRVAGIADGSISLADLRDRRFAYATSRVTLVTASEDDHGRAVAWGARIFGCSAIIFLHEDVSIACEESIRALGAETVRIAGGFGDSVRAAAREAERCNYVVVSDTSHDHVGSVPADTIQGCSVIIGEILEDPHVRPTQVFLQAGAGPLAAAVCGYLREYLGPARPRFVIVQSGDTARHYESAAARRPATVPSRHGMNMARFSPGGDYSLAWQILGQCADAFLIVGDDDARRASSALYCPAGDDPQIVASDLGAAGLAGVMAAAGTPEVGLMLGLSRDSRVLLIGTNSDIEPNRFAPRMSEDGSDSSGLGHRASGRIWNALDAPRGFEPRLTESESVVLPLDDGAEAGPGAR